MVETRSKNLRMPEGGKTWTVWHTGESFFIFLVLISYSPAENPAAFLREGFAAGRNTGLNSNFIMF
jgi:hypothetical protein